MPPGVSPAMADMQSSPPPRPAEAPAGSPSAGRGSLDAAASEPALLPRLLQSLSLQPTVPASPSSASLRCTCSRIHAAVQGLLHDVWRSWVGVVLLLSDCSPALCEQACMISMLATCLGSASWKGMLNAGCSMVCMLTARALRTHGIGQQTACRDDADGNGWPHTPMTPSKLVLQGLRACGSLALCWPARSPCSASVLVNDATLWRKLASPHLTSSALT